MVKSDKNTNITKMTPEARLLDPRQVENLFVEIYETNWIYDPDMGPHSKNKKIFYQNKKHTLCQKALQKESNKSIVDIN